MYGVASLRELGRKGLLTKGDDESVERLMTLPATVEDILNLAEANRETLLASFCEDERKLYSTALLDELYLSLNKGSDGSGAGMLQIQLVAFDDEHSNNELVHGIEINQ